MSLAAATDGAVFHAYLEPVLLPALRRVKPDAGNRCLGAPSGYSPGRRRQRPTLIRSTGQGGDEGAVIRGW